MKRSVAITALACFGAFCIAMILNVVIYRITGWDDPKGLMTAFGVIAAMVTWHEARP